MKDIDKLQKRNRKLRDLTERAGSTGLAITGLIGLLFLGVLVWQIAEPTFIKGEQGEITPAVLPHMYLTGTQAPDRSNSMR